MAKIARRGVMFVLSSPSGAGKTTIARRLLEENKDLVLSISVTTREKRPSEVDGRDYRFIKKNDFDRMVARDELLEHAEVFGNHYGTPKDPVEDALASGKNVLFDIDWQGADQLRKAMPDDVVSVFILPPSRKELESRLRRRAEDPDDVVKARMEKASGEIVHWDDYEHVVINENLDAAIREVTGILSGATARRVRQPGLEEFVAKLLEE